MIELFEQQLQQVDRHSSKGNQLKWENNGIWYKADYTGYEGLAEFVVSHLLEYSTLDRDEYVLYELEDIRYKRQIFHGAKSKDFLSDDWQIITLERLYKNYCNKSLYETVWKIRDVKERFVFLSEQIEHITGIKEFGRYLAKLLTIDAFFLNEDRHMHNIAILMNGNGAYKLCPVFDNGASMLSDTRLDYPMDTDVYLLMHEAKAKTISYDFDEQLDAAEALYQKSLLFNFTSKEVDKILSRVENYSQDEIERVRRIIYLQMKKYSYLFQ